MAAWLNKEVHREVRAAAREFVKVVVLVVLWLRPAVKQESFFHSIGRRRKERTTRNSSGAVAGDSWCSELKRGGVCTAVVCFAAGHRTILQRPNKIDVTLNPA